MKNVAVPVFLIFGLVVCVFLFASSLEGLAVEYDKQLEEERHKQRIHEFCVSRTDDISEYNECINTELPK